MESDSDRLLDEINNCWSLDCGVLRALMVLYQPPDTAILVVSRIHQSFNFFPIYLLSFESH
jgi:hypothetical protein